MAKTKVKVRVLVDVTVDGKAYKPNQAVAFSADKAKSLERSGQVDSTPAAVAYVVANGGKVIEHDDGAPEQASAQTETGSDEGDA